MQAISMRQMLEAGVHFGHRTRYWNPKMAPYIFGTSYRIHIIDLEKTLPLFKAALSFIEQLATRRGKILFVGTKFTARRIIQEEATRCAMPYVDYRWLGGMLTNYKTIRQSIKRLKNLEEKLTHMDQLSGMTKKEVLNLVRVKDKLSAALSGIKNMGGLPDALFVIDVCQEKIAVQEANRLGIPVIAIVDTNASPEGVDYPIPGNDDAIRAIRFYCQHVADTIIEARQALAEESGETAQAVEETPVAPVKRVVLKKSKSPTGDQVEKKEEETKQVQKGTDGVQVHSHADAADTGGDKGEPEKTSKQKVEEPTKGADSK